MRFIYGRDEASDTKRRPTDEMKTGAKSDSTRGSALVEFAIAIPLFLLLVVGLVDLGRGVWARNSLAYLARGAVRYASVRSINSGDPATPQTVHDWIVTQNTGLNPADIAVTANWQPSNTPGSTVQITLDYDFVPVTKLIGVSDIPLSTSARLTISF